MKERTDGLQRLKPGVYVNPSDDRYELKAMRYQAISPSSPIHEAKLLVRAGQYRKAKERYLTLLRHKESMELHKQLAPLLTYDETLDMLNKYWHFKQLRRFYQDHAKTYAQRSTTRRARMSWLPWLLLCLVLLALPFLYHYVYRHTITTTIDESYQNTIEHIGVLPSTQFAGNIRVGTLTTNGIAHAVDTSTMTPDLPYKLLYDGTPEGYAVSEGDNLFTIYILNTVAPSASVTTQRAPVSSAPTSAISSADLNVARTAYAYYLTTHGDVPPATLQPLASMVPRASVLSNIDYVPTTDPTTALTSSATRIVPFVQPVVRIDLRDRTLLLQSDGQTVLRTAVGIGAASSPTPTGDFVVSQRIVNHAANAYGKYIFPLNETNYAIHGTNQEGRIGGADSLGCIELPASALQKLYDTIPVGTRVEIENGATLSPPTWFKA
ncbi:L,D-transpeptidase [Alicyclobacillus fastidiosus]|uniref:L,D-transpeptidase n=1 Tax=Alicyclobacillus fastidiosus TaxID=392011 RepID=A0ABY6ZBX0_9BACL|nr:L,D-transpeptidase [Alicyclobacillus fastidiosus]WAH40366.1 L,D-transpeptidase [Alicyclobacillus fastidiosus]GMA61751.1 hypothetical protein GCM10025859_21910 [Alicyclobacillus fastidiosus]